ncbi:hypothetical protein Cabys_3545 [Caldithrix abyssi DSM 13497]|uniref:Uncharacterized protein n=1 Tax=Caldithrix abyssi DSM 13497 TaxID=880073 RepID=A0A1J1CC62_CALAY|nr:hypothetical protein Cabys_3545 [Caldithrix abyssi DSM 13497]
MSFLLKPKRLVIIHYWFLNLDFQDYRIFLIFFTSEALLHILKRNFGMQKK